MFGLPRRMFGLTPAKLPAKSGGMRATKANCFGSVWLRASKPAKNRTQKWRVVFLFRGRESSETTPFLVCPACQAEPGADACRGARDCRRQALNFGLGELKRMTDRWTEHGDAGPVVVVEPVPVGPPMTVGDLLRVSVENYGLARESESCALHAAQAMRRVIAHSKGLWKVKTTGEGPRGIAPGDRYADAERIAISLLLTQIAIVCTLATLLTLAFKSAPK